VLADFLKEKIDFPTCLEMLEESFSISLFRYKDKLLEINPKSLLVKKLIKA